MKFNRLNMNKIINSLYFILLGSLIFIGCSELEDNITSVSKPKIHGEGVLDKNSPNFHGRYFDKLKFRDCQNCHAKYFQGGLTPVNCGSVNCHPSIYIHVDLTGVNEITSPNFHGRYLLKHSFNDCQQCHGGNFAGGLSSPSCVTCHSAIGVHKPGINNPSSADFHGKFPLQNGFSDCKQCHGQNFGGGISSPSCITCHSGIVVHKTGINDLNSPNFHGKFIATTNWNLQNCTQCHGSNYSGGFVSPTCLTCHNQPNGPEACNTCHGEFNNPARIAPNLGSHFAHLYENHLGKKVECDQCHVVPAAFSSPGHIDGISGAEIIFGDLAKLKTNSPGAFSQTPTLPEFVPNPAYNTAQGSCSNVYCHGYFKNGNLDNVVSFNATSVNCGSCHGNSATGDPMPKTSAQGGSHPAIQNCSLCHGDVVAVSGNTYTIIDSSKHINGKLNVFGQEQNY